MQTDGWNTGNDGQPYVVCHNVHCHRRILLVNPTSDMPDEPPTYPFHSLSALKVVVKENEVQYPYCCTKCMIIGEVESL